MQSDLPALLIIDMQKGMASPAAGPRNNPGAEGNIAALLQRWRDINAPVVHVRHISRTPGSLFWPGQPGAEFQDALAPLAAAHVVEKTSPTPSSTRAWSAGCGCAASTSWCSWA